MGRFIPSKNFFLPIFITPINFPIFTPTNPLKLVAFATILALWHILERVQVLAYPLIFVMIFLLLDFVHVYERYLFFLMNYISV